MNVFASLTALTAVFFSAMLAQAAQVVYDVHISGISHDSPEHLMRVEGTVTFDDAVQEVITSSLVFIHESDAPLAFPAQPSINIGSGSLWHWQATPTELRIIDDPAEYYGGTIAWSVPTGGPSMDDYAIFGVTGTGGNLYYGFYGTEPAEPGHFDDTIFPYLVNNGDLSGKPGFRLGTALPEPSTIALAACGALGLLIAARRKRRSEPSRTTSLQDTTEGRD